MAGQQWLKLKNKLLSDFSKVIKKNKKGDIIVDHAGKKGKYDKINLTKKAGAKTVKAGVKATKDWHKKNG